MLAADLVADDVAEERRDDQQHQRDQQLDDGRAGEEVDLPGGDEQAQREQQRVARQEREEQPALDEDDDQADPEELGAEPVEQPVGVHPVDAEQQRAAGRATHAQRTRRAPDADLSRLAGDAPSGAGTQDDERGAVRPDAARPARGRASGRGRGRWPAGEQYDARPARARVTGATSSTATATGRWTAIVADLDTRRHDFHVAIENWQHDFNIGTIVRTANAFLAARGAHRRQPALEPARRDGDRPLPARPAPRRRRRPGGVPARARAAVRCWASTTCPAREHLETMDAAAPGLLPLRPGGPGPLRGARARSATAPSRSRSSARPARSTPRPPRRSRCTPGCAQYADLSATTPGGAEPLSDQELGQRRLASRRPRGPAVCSGRHVTSAGQPDGLRPTRVSGRVDQLAVRPAQRPGAARPRGPPESPCRAVVASAAGSCDACRRPHRRCCARGRRRGSADAASRATATTASGGRRHRAPDRRRRRRPAAPPAARTSDGSGSLEVATTGVGMVATSAASIGLRRAGARRPRRPARRLPRRATAATGASSA